LSPTRRQFLTATTAAAAVPLTLSACGGFSTAGSDPTPQEGTLTFTTWGTDAELAGFNAAIEAFQAANDGVTVQLNAVPYEQMFTNIDASCST
jgi:ABC-type glycerol-3-phosphate transport system substrate-binding protein